MQTAEILSEHGVQATVVNARFCKPLDQALIHPLASSIGRVVTMEEGCRMGGFGSAIAESLLDAEILVPVVRIGIGDVLVEHATAEESKVDHQLTPDLMADRILKLFAKHPVSV
jgi:1-deoxy-D-xylulose-5-phosphate synthase